MQIRKRPGSVVSTTGPADWIGVDVPESTCSIDDCDRLVIARGWCKGHYSRWRKHGDPLGGTPLGKSRHKSAKCAVPGCDCTSRTRGFCPLHYGRWRINGTTNLLRDSPCSAADCGKRAFSDGFCRTHWVRWQKYGDPGLHRQCIIDGCPRFAPAGKRGWCLLHYTRWSKHGDVGPAEPRFFQPPHEPTEGHLWCTTCRNELPLKDFQRDGKTASGYARVCRDCVRDRRVAEYYGISGEQYRALLDEQGHVCRICRKPETATHQMGTLRRLAVDHDHKCCPGQKSCGKCVRGLLCSRCNSAIGFVGEDLSVIESMAAYLRRKPWVEPAEPGEQGALWSAA
jgi:hypothetical protein